MDYKTIKTTKVLLHICCAPCAIYPVEWLRKAGHEVRGFFYNPNIHPYIEYMARKEAVEKYAHSENLKVACGEYEIEKFFQNVVRDEGLKSDRCPLCWWMRLRKTAQVATVGEFEAITTTLLVSPYQDHGLIASIGVEICRNSGLLFIGEDFRPGFRDARNKAKSEGIYCQNYCGCLFSERERYALKEKKKKTGKKIDPLEPKGPASDDG
ncbi:MAG: epoxyqueuosine reductase QueH [Candidatus Omnitrophota bacterium]